MTRTRRHRMFGVAVALLVGGWALGGADLVAAASDAQPTEDVFRKFTTTTAERSFIRPVIQLFRDKHYAGAEKLLRQLAEKFPDSALYRYNLAAALARQGKKTQAFDSLALAIEKGFSSVAILERDPDFDSLRGEARYRAILSDVKAAAARRAKAAAVKIYAAMVEQGRALVDETNTAWEPRSNTLIAGFEFPPESPGDTVHGGKEPIAKRLNDWFRNKEAAGNYGDLYDNRDRGHSRLSRELLPQVAHIEYGNKARTANLDYGVNPGILFNAVTFGNSSTALKDSVVWRSQARLVLTDAELVGRAYVQYANNHLYVFPEHTDHDKGLGDLFPANTPYMIVSQGSSGSDQPFLHAVGVILAAFRPEVKQFLRQHKLVMPTVQMIFRKGQKPVRDEGDYLSAKAQPSVYTAANIDLEKMAALAHGLTVGTIPPVVTLAVEDESKGRTGVDYFSPPGIGETLFDTPSAIARLVRSTRYVKRIVVNAERTKDPNGRPLTFHWVVLRGDADRIKIKPLDKKGTKVELRIPWHERHAVPYLPELQSDRVDIGVFASNGAAISAPAFVSLYYPGDQKRTYDDAGRIRCVDYDNPEFRKRYVDPLLFPTRDWRDCYEYDASGALLGWNRVMGSSVQRFTRDGAKVVESDGEGRPIKAERVRYEIELQKVKRPRIVPVMTGEIVRYRYKGPDDRIGTRANEDK